MFLLVTILITLYFAYRLYKNANPAKDIDPKNKFVLISGCDTGFGHSLAVELDQKEFNVLAGVYDSRNIEKLEKILSKRATVFRLDVTSNDDIQAAYELVAKKTSTLHALVNNAGIGKGGLIDWTSTDFIRTTMEVNFFGQVTMIKTFLPLLLSKAGSRVVNLCSVAGFLAGPGMSAYAASKFAFEAFSDSLRREMKAWDLFVSIIEPGFMRTPIIQDQSETLRQLWNQSSSDVKQRWGEEYFERFAKRMSRSPLIKHAEDPMKVVRALTHAVMNSEPEIRYRPGWQSKLLFPISLLPGWIGDYVFVQMRQMNVQPAGVLQRKQ